MRLKRHLVLLAALPLLVGANGYAQKPVESKQAVEPTRDATDVLTVIGCVQRESDYRTAIGEGKGGVAGTGLGDSREFVLRAVRTVSTNLVPVSKPGKFEEV